MIVFDLKCAQAHVFEVWFRDSAAYEAQTKAGEIVCPICGDTAIDKAPMAPNLARRGEPDRDGEVDKRDIYGQATDEEASALKDEGIEIGQLPWLPRHDS